jgi:hypothetical protein
MLTFQTGKIVLHALGKFFNPAHSNDYLQGCDRVEFLLDWRP